jgi:hypothetical protein
MGMVITALPGGLFWFLNPDRRVEEVTALPPDETTQT